MSQMKQSKQSTQNPFLLDTSLHDAARLFGASNECIKILCEQPQINRFLNNHEVDIPYDVVTSRIDS